MPLLTPMGVSDVQFLVGLNEHDPILRAVQMLNEALKNVDVSLPPEWLHLNHGATVADMPKWDGKMPPAADRDCIPIYGYSGVLSWWSRDNHCHNSKWQPGATAVVMSGDASVYQSKYDAAKTKAMQLKRCLLVNEVQ